MKRGVPVMKLGVIGFILGTIYGSFGVWYLYLRGKENHNHGGIHTVPPSTSPAPKGPGRQY